MDLYNNILIQHNGMDRIKHHEVVSKKSQRRKN